MYEKRPSALQPMTLLSRWVHRRSAGYVRPQKCAEIPLGCKQNNHFTNDAVHSCGLLSFKFRSQYNRIPGNCQPSFYNLLQKISDSLVIQIFLGDRSLLPFPFSAFLERGLGETILWPPKNGFPQHFFTPSAVWYRGSVGSVFPPALPWPRRASCATASYRPRCRDGSWWPNRPGPARPAWEP